MHINFTNRVQINCLVYTKKKKSFQVLFFRERGDYFKKNCLCIKCLLVFNPKKVSLSGNAFPKFLFSSWQITKQLFQNQGNQVWNTRANTMTVTNPREVQIKQNRILCSVNVILSRCILIKMSQLQGRSNVQICAEYVEYTSNVFKPIWQIKN